MKNNINKQQVKCLEIIKESLNQKYNIDNVYEKDIALGETIIINDCIAILDLNYLLKQFFKDKVDVRIIISEIIKEYYKRGGKDE